MAENGSFCRKLAYIFALFVVLMILLPSVAGNSITRGGIFTVSIVGKPVTGYYVWLTGTSTMSGEPGDQPPVIVGGTEDVEFDPDEGPYSIGSYEFYGGNGKTIREDVAPSSETVSNTRYYAKLTTDSDGYGIVEFQTSSATADRTFTIKAQNPSAPADEVPVMLGLPPTKTPTMTPTPSLPVQTVTFPPPSVVPASPAITTPAPQEPATPVTTTNAPATSMSPGAPVPIPVILGAVAAAGFLLRRTG